MLQEASVYKTWNKTGVSLTDLVRKYYLISTESIYSSFLINSL